jgi:hypothetical protein
MFSLTILTLNSFSFNAMGESAFVYEMTNGKVLSASPCPAWSSTYRLKLG